MNIPAYKGNDPYVFVCYAHANENIVYPEIQWLHDQGVNVWYDEGISAGRVWRGEIADALQDASRVIFYISKSSIESDHCRREIHYALDKNIPVVPVYLEEVPLTGDLEIGLNLVQALFRESDASYQQHLLRAVGQPSKKRDLPDQKEKTWARTLSIGLLAAIALGVIGWYLQSRDEMNLTESDLAILRDDGSKIKLAVLTLRDLSQKQDISWLAEGVSEELRQRLGTLQRFEVIPGAFLRGLTINSLDVNTRLAIDGSIQGTGSDISVKLDVIDVQKERILWTADFQGKNNDPLELQQQITTAIARVFDASLGDGSRGPTQPEAYALYLNFVYEQWGDPEADAHALERILQLDPNWVEGWQDLTSSWFRIWVQIHDESFLTKARNAAEKADGISGGGASFVIEANLKAYLDGNLDGAEKDFRIMASEWGYGFAYAELMNHSGLYAEAEAYFEQLIEVNPYHPNAIGIWDQLAVARLNLGDLYGALDAGRRHNRLIPPKNNWPQSGFPRILPETGKLEEARKWLGQTLQSLEESRKGSAGEIHNRALANRMAFEIAIAEGDTQRALVLAGEIASVNPSSAGISYLILDDPRAEQFLTLAGETPSHWRIQWAYHTSFIPLELRNHPLILDLEEKLGFDKAWRLELCKRAATLPPESLISCDPGKYTL